MLKKRSSTSRYGSFYAGVVVASICVAALPASVVLAGGEDSAVVERPLVEVSMADTNPNETLKKAIIEAKVQADETLNLSDVDIEQSKIELNGFDRTQSGLQNVTARVSLSSENEATPVSYTFIQDVTIKMVKTGAPQLKLKSDEVIVNNGDSFVPTNYIAYINDDSGVLPMLEIEESVNMEVDGIYPVTYTAIDVEGNKTTAELKVEVKTPEEVIRAREEAERKAREEAERLEAERRAEEERIRQEQEAARIAAEQEAARQAAIAAAQAAAAEAAANGDGSDAVAEAVANAAPVYGGGSNPYWGGWSNCTWGAWQLAYDIGGVALPGWGNAGTWVGSAQASGYATGTEPRANAIAVYTNHVAYVDSVEGGSVHIQEGGYLGHYMSRWVAPYTDGSQALIGYIYLP